jgi:hypothetical protein
MRGFKIAVLLLSFVLIPFKSYAFCANSIEAQAFSVRALKSSLMIAALSCNQNKAYNRFIKAHDDILSRSGNRISAFFEKEYGSNAKTHLNKFITHLANDASKASMSSDDDFCQVSADLFSDLRHSDQEELLDIALSDNYASIHGIQNCESNVKVAHQRD